MSLGNAAERLGALGDGTRRRLLATAAVANTLVLLSLLYAVLAGRSPTGLWAVPIVWFAVGTWGLLGVSPGPAGRRTKLLAGALAVGYFGVLAFVGGLVAPGGEPAAGLTLQVTELPPGWNPALLYGGETVRFALVPFSLFGYLTLAYLVYGTALEARSAVAGGALGLFSCVSCTVPVVASLLGGVLGGGAALAAAASEGTYALGSVAFVLTVVLLRYRPGLDRIRGGL